LDHPTIPLADYSAAFSNFLILHAWSSLFPRTYAVIFAVIFVCKQCTRYPNPNDSLGLSLLVPPGCPIDGHESGAVLAPGFWPFWQWSGCPGLAGSMLQKKDGLGNLGWVQYFGSVVKTC
jgi:hypothetical protein